MRGTVAKKLRRAANLTGQRDRALKRGWMRLPRGRVRPGRRKMRLMSFEDGAYMNVTLERPAIRSVASLNHALRQVKAAAEAKMADMMMGGNRTVK